MHKYISHLIVFVVYCDFNALIGLINRKNVLVLQLTMYMVVA